MGRSQGQAGMPEFVHDLSMQELALWFPLLSVIVGLVVVKPVLRILLGSGSDLNEAIGYATASFSLFYGLLLGPLTVSAYRNNDRIGQAILGKASALSALCSDMNVYPEPIRSDMRTMLRDYVLLTIHKDWPTHPQGGYLDGGENRSNAMRQKLAAFEPETRRQEILHAQVLCSFQKFVDARQQRVIGVFVRIPNVLWYAVLVGAGLNILLIVMLRMRPMRQVFLGSVAAVFLSVILFVIVALDQPMRGESGLGPKPIQRVWDRTMTWDEPQY